MEQLIRIIEEMLAWSFSIFSNEEYIVERGDPITQKFFGVHEFTKKTERREGGFGSTNVWCFFVFLAFEVI